MSDITVHAKNPKTYGRLRYEKPAETDENLTR